LGGVQISDGQLSAQLNSAEGTLTFQEHAFDGAQFSPEAIHALYVKAQNDQAALVELGKDLNASKAVLTKV
jgi:hypothetical protein